MLFTNLLVHAQRHIEKRRRYNRLANEIECLSPRELADLRADRSQMLGDLRRDFYG
ncbi:hypothetical protein [Tianweitania sediminis]|uniref:Uncharacterized protein n=1 Tax=Tianweitania sediminis TaxID=1502156 RepID=A0A8J7R0K7_9HYPH|nr:hypothetical protein [Tianweitania sediminis]MBP0437806.1 hypothetical protein [Tianweitania sediminis]